MKAGKDMPDGFSWVTETAYMKYLMTGRIDRLKDTLSTKSVFVVSSADQ